MAISIGPINLENNVILAPMSGVTDMPFRRLVKRQGAALVISEMIASQALIRESRKTLKMIMKTPEEFPMSVQLAGCEPEAMAEAAKLNEDLGANIIDINMGCPAKKVVNGYAGSALMKEELKAAKIIEATVKAVSLPVTLKMRTGWDDNSRNAPQLAKIAEDLGVKMITVHGRTRCQFYNGRADWDFIAEVKNSVKIPVIGNGDVKTEEDAKTLLEKSQADGVMIGRGAYGRPWFLNQVSHYLKTAQKLPQPNIFAMKDIMIEHYQEMLSHHGGEYGVRLARKHLGWYSKGLPNSADFRSKVNLMDDADQVLSFMTQFFDQCIDKELSRMAA
ncbi:tRNA dihydrouridine synthase DusB [Candidatus Nucleicultrix amoebiphila]|jgi:tRNA-dihydrouridine synthase B|uniref:tRNA-dihydrouridine synthase n=1 Tax=Candidatus Nucleicultrix amoebiphila FS5 TaxID=1414854 RepID=A0A1W6N2S9_9PROT|nr:tRNA dihydrouridine synthase DusB [Candidatus Nucleicultrix amoebiphila]ARN84142.1 tRNA-dihydrouridine synthase [Candidatus Nucleicultrix amoebiphila FS5]